jgi:hypothetical protein
LANIRLNKDDPYKSGSDGDMFHALATAQDRLTNKINLVGAAFGQWALNEHGVSLNQAPRIKTILTNDRYVDIAKQVVNTPWGRKGFVIEHFSRLCTQHVSRVRFSLDKRGFIRCLTKIQSNKRILGYLLKKNQDCFGGWAFRLTEEDLTMINTIPLPQDEQKETLRDLFFPRQGKTQSLFPTMPDAFFNRAE